MVRGGKHKPQRGGTRRFTSSRDPDAYIHGPSRRAEDSTESSDSQDSASEAGSDFEESPDKLVAKVKAMSLKGDDEAATLASASASDSDAGSETEASTRNDKKSPIKGTTSKPSQTAPRELTRREREAMEKEKARQHFLKIKEKEDAARLAVIRKRREEEAARHAAEQKAKEEALLTRRR